ncbi:MAG: hypothetical protein AAFR04_08160 [Pseudomonadota bacterium]
MIDTMPTDAYEVIALRYGTMTARTRKENFIAPGAHGSPGETAGRSRWRRPTSSRCSILSL